jgi:hypothetical protein
MSDVRSGPKPAESVILTRATRISGNSEVDACLARRMYSCHEKAAIKGQMIS